MCASSLRMDEHLEGADTLHGDRCPKDCSGQCENGGHASNCDAMTNRTDSHDCIFLLTMQLAYKYWANEILQL